MSSSSKKKQSPAPRQQGTTAIIRQFVKNLDNELKEHAPEEINKKALDLLTKENKEEIVASALLRYCDTEELKPYQAELIKMHAHLEKVGKKMIILFDGRDASGKGGTIRAVTRYMNAKGYRVEALGKPSDDQRTELHMKRYIERFPHAGEIVLFDRSWYNRAMVEPVMGFCSNEQYNRFLHKVTTYEQNFILDAGKTILLKLYFSVTKEEQARRFARRKNDPLRQWKLSEVDLQAQDLWDEFTKKKKILLQKTHTKDAKWWIVRSDNKHLARLETMKLILRSVKYLGRSRTLDLKANDEVLIPGDKELKMMLKQEKEFGIPLS